MAGNRRTMICRSVVLWTALCSLAAAQEITIPPVQLSASHAALCKVKVGDKFPAVALPKLDGGPAKLADLAGEKATVVVFWKGDRRTSQMALGDLQRDVAAKLGDQGVAVVGIAVEESAESASATLQKAEAQFANLIDADGAAFAAIGSEKLPRIYLLDPQGKILWFDIDYSLATRRELNQALQTILGAN